MREGTYGDERRPTPYGRKLVTCAWEDCARTFDPDKGHAQEQGWVVIGEYDWYCPEHKEEGRAIGDFRKDDPS